MMNYHKPNNVPVDLKQKLMEALKSTAKPIRGGHADQADALLSDVTPGLDFEAREDVAEPTPVELIPGDNVLEDGSSVYRLLVGDDEETALEEPLPQELEAASNRLNAQLNTVSLQETGAKTEINDTLSLENPSAEQEPSAPATSHRPAEEALQAQSTVEPQADSKKIDSKKDVSLVQNTVVSGGTMADLSGYKDLSKAPLSFGSDLEETHTMGSSREDDTFDLGVQFTAASQAQAHALPQEVDTEFSGNVKTLIRLVNELPEGVTKQTGAQIIRLTMEAMGISMEDVLTEAQSAQSEMLDAVRANIKKIEEYKTVIRKLETDIKYYQGKANELSEIIDLFILSNTSGNRTPSVDDLNH